jgi:hypothetical protein
VQIYIFSSSSKRVFVFMYVRVLLIDVLLVQLQNMADTLVLLTIITTVQIPTLSDTTRLEFKRSGEPFGGWK